jgi:hypothetical protein
VHHFPLVILARVYELARTLHPGTTAARSLELILLQARDVDHSIRCARRMSETIRRESGNPSIDDVGKVMCILGIKVRDTKLVDGPFYSSSMPIAHVVPVSLGQRVGFEVNAILRINRGFHFHENSVEKVSSVVARADNVCYTSELVAFTVKRIVAS